MSLGAFDTWKVTILEVYFFVLDSWNRLFSTLYLDDVLTNFCMYSNGLDLLRNSEFLSAWYLNFLSSWTSWAQKYFQLFTTELYFKNVVYGMLDIKKLKSWAAIFRKIDSRITLATTLTSTCYRCTGIDHPNASMINFVTCGNINLLTWTNTCRCSLSIIYR